MEGKGGRGSREREGGGGWGDDEKSQILSAVAQRLASHQISIG